MFDVLRESDDGIHVCTTNYDQMMENYINESNNGYSCVDGFDLDQDTQKNLFDQLNFKPNNDTSKNTTCYLYKLHGSLNWIPCDLNGDDKICRRELEEYQDNNFVIYPTLGKKDEYYNEPYSFLMKKFKERIDNSDMFIVIGYSFRDDVINEQFKKFLNKDHTKIFVISPTAEDDTLRICEDENKLVSFHYENGTRHIYDKIILPIHKANTGNTFDPQKIKTFIETAMPSFFDEKIKVINSVVRLEDAGSMFKLIQMYSQVCNKI